VEDDDPTAEDAETITPDELDDLLDDGTPTRVVVLRQPGSGFAVASVTLAVCGIGLGLVPAVVEIDEVCHRVLGALVTHPAFRHEDGIGLQSGVPSVLESFHCHQGLYISRQEDPQVFVTVCELSPRTFHSFC
jgi:hypothetical protein